MTAIKCRCTTTVDREPCGNKDVERDGLCGFCLRNCTPRRTDENGRHQQGGER